MAIGQETRKRAQEAYRTALAQTSKELENRIFEMGSLRQIGELFEKSSRMEDVVTRGLEILLGASPAERGSVMLYFPGSEELCLLAAGTRDSGRVVYFGPAGNPERSFLVGEGVAGSCLERGEAILASDVSKEPRFVPAHGRTQVGSLACMPLSSEGKPLGVVNLSTTLPGGITHDQLPLLSILSSYLGIALSNSILLEQLKSSNEELEKKVRQRTRKLEQANGRLMAAQAQINEHNEQLQEKVRERTESLEKTLTELRERTDSLERANRIKDEFLNNINHELKTPLNAIIGYAGLLRMEAAVALSAEQRADLDLIESNGRHLQQILDNIFALKAIEGGDITLDRQPTPLNELVQSAAASLLPRAKEKGLSISFEPCPQNPVLAIDRTLILRAVYNLLDNATKFSEKGTIRVRTLLKDSDFWVEVADEGPGVRAEDAERIFEKFQQAEPALRKKRGGSGVGLAIARTLVRLHGGELVLTRPASGKGAIFSFNLPAW
jgi:signal transduction histidine kinase